MNAIEAKIKKLESFKASINDKIRDIIKANEVTILNYNRENQLFELGETSEGIKISSYAPYTRLTIVNKQIKKQPVDRVTLKDTSAFYTGFYIIYEDDQFTIWSNDKKTTDLVTKYGIEIFGLSNDNIAKFSHSYVYEKLKQDLATEL